MFSRIISRQKAISLNLRWYFTGRPCKHGHVAKRLTVQSTCETCLRKIEKKYYIKNADKFKATSKKWHSENKERHRETIKKCKAAKPQQYRDLEVKKWTARRARKKNSIGSFTEAEVRKLFQKQKEKCANCKKKISLSTLHRDHVEPLAKGGTNWIVNIQLLCADCNRKKGAKDPISFAQENGRLL